MLFFIDVFFELWIYIIVCTFRVIRTTRTPANTPPPPPPPPPHYYPYYLFTSDPKSKQDKEKVTNLEKLP